MVCAASARPLFATRWSLVLTLVLLSALLVASGLFVTWVWAMRQGLYPPRPAMALPSGTVPQGIRWETRPADERDPPLDLAGLDAAWKSTGGTGLVPGGPSLWRTVVHPEGLATETEYDVAPNCLRLLARIFPRSLADSVTDWRHGHVARAPGALFQSTPQVIAVGGLEGDLAAPDGTSIPVRGRIGISEYHVLLAMRLLAEEPVANADLLIPTALICWPPGYEALAPADRSALAGGMTWTLGTWGSEAMLGWERDGLWPTRVACWSDGTWAALSVFIDGDKNTGTAVITRPPPFLLRPDVEARCFPKPIQRYAFSPALGGAAIDAKIVNRHRPINASGLRLRILSDDEWASGQEGTIPEEVARRFGLAPDTRSLLVDLHGSRPFGDATAGLIQCSGRSVADPRAGPCQWVLGEDYLALTLVANTPGGMSGVGRVSDDGMARIAWYLPMLLGEDGLRISAVPAGRRKGPVADGVLIWPRPTTLVGFPEQYRVGDSTWGKARIYAHPLYLHVLLPRGGGPGASTDWPDPEEGAGPT